MADGSAPDAVVERAATIPVSGSGTLNTAVSVPLTLNIGEGVEGVALNVKVEVAYQTKQRGTIAVGEVGHTESEAAPQPKKKGLMSRLFGGG